MLGTEKEAQQVIDNLMMQINSWYDIAREYNYSTLDTKVVEQWGKK